VRHHQQEEGIEMPWFQEYIGAAELARKLTRDAGHEDPVTQYLVALNRGDAHELRTAWPGEVVVHDPRAGKVRGNKELRRFVKQSGTWLGEHQARIDPVASTSERGRAAVEVLVHLSSDGQEIAWPVAVVAESPNDRAVEFRTYCSQWPVDGRRKVRGPILEAAEVQAGDIAGRHLNALAAGDVDAVLATFAPDGYYQESMGTRPAHRGTAELRAFFTEYLSAGGIRLQPCRVTDDGVRCAVEYNCVRWGSQDLPSQAGFAVYERDPDGLLAAVRVYDDVEAPVQPAAAAG
jgi:ketosteroid isomerase-like protein